MRTPDTVRGFSLIEVLVTISILAILVSLAVPSMVSTLDKRRLVGAAETVAAELQLARTESVKRSATVYLSFVKTSATEWCMGLSVGAQCTCTTTGSCTLDGVERVVSSTDFADSTTTVPRLDEAKFGSVAYTSFDPVRGTATAGHVYLESADGLQLRVVVSILGLVRLCSPSGSGNVSGYPTSGCS